MSNHDQHACREYNELSRRQFLQASGGAAAFLATVPAWLPKVAYAGADCSSRDVIISIFLRGAADGLTMCVPYGDPGYYAPGLRPLLTIPRPDSTDPNRATAITDYFGLPPAMTPLLDAYNAGQLLFVHATGITNANRSHFDAQRYMEIGKWNDPTLFTGWLGRHLATAPPLVPGSALRGVGLSFGLQQTLVGGPQALPIPNLDTYGLSGTSTTVTQREVTLDQLYDLPGNELVRAAANNTIRTIDLLDAINFSGYVPAGGAAYPTDGFGNSLKSTAALIKAEVGVEAVAIDVGGWDTHNAQGVFTGGAMFNLMNSLAGGLRALHLDLFNGGANTNVTVVVMTEFGRRAYQNGSAGTDHGYGCMMMVMGEYVSGGRVLTNWPGLSPGQLYADRDLAITIDYRDILAEIVQNRLDNPNLAAVFPDYAPTFRGVTTC